MQTTDSIKAQQRARCRGAEMHLTSMAKHLFVEKICQCGREEQDWLEIMQSPVPAELLCEHRLVECLLIVSWEIGVLYFR